MNRLNDILTEGYYEDPNALWQANPVPSQVEKKTFKVGNEEYVIAPKGYKEPSMLELGEFVAKGLGRTWLEKQKERWDYMTSPIEENPMTKEQMFDAAMNWAPMGMGQIKAFHGSPHKFDKFKMEKLGTGEGSQSFGYGLYFTSEKDIAKHYSGVKSPIFEDLNRIFIDGEMLKDKGHLELVLFEAEGDIKKAISNTEHHIKYGHSASKASFQKVLDQLKEWQSTNTKIEIKGPENPTVYSVTLHKGKEPGEYDYLKWDELLNNNQISKILSQANKENKKLFGILESQQKLSDGEYLTNNPGNYIYHTLSEHLGSDREASAFLLRAGIDGIEYPAGTPSGMKSNAKNYVVFDENAITIEK